MKRKHDKNCKCKVCRKIREYYEITYGREEDLNIRPIVNLIYGVDYLK